MIRHIFMVSAAMLALDTAAMAQSCSAPSVADQVDLVPVADSNLMTVPVEINGTQKQFLLDIGTDHTEISAAAATELRLPSGNQSNDALPLAPGAEAAGEGSRNFNSNATISAAMQDVGGSRNPQDFAPRVRAATFEIGGVTGKSMQLVIANDKEMGKTKPWDGRMTGDMFAQYDIDFDFGAGKLGFMTATNCADLKQVAYWAHSEVAVIPMKLSEGKIKVPVIIGGHQLDAVIETGSAKTVMRRAVGEDFGLVAGSAEVPADGDARDGMGQPIYVHVFPQISFGGVIAQNIPVRIQANSMVHPINRTPILGSRAQFAPDPTTKLPDLAIGMDVLRKLHIYAAFGQDKLYVTAADVPPAIPKSSE
jgi:hypothetical protein